MIAKVAVLTPVFGHAEYLAAMLDSLQKQTMPFWECAVVLDGPDGRAEEIARAFSEDDPRISVTVFARHCGLPAARNAAARATTAPWLLPFDADDLMDAEYMRRLFEAAGEVNTPPTQYPVCFSPARLAYDDGRVEVFRYPHYDRSGIADRVQIPGSALFPRALYDALKGYDEAWNHGATDWMFWIRGAAENLLYPVQVDGALWTYRQHAGPRHHRRGVAVLPQLRPHMRRALAGQRAYGEPLVLS